MLLSTLRKRRPLQLHNEQSQQSLQGYLSQARGALLKGTNIHYSLLCELAFFQMPPSHVGSWVKNINRKGLTYCNYSFVESTTRSLGIVQSNIQVQIPRDINYVLSSKCMTAYKFSSCDIKVKLLP